MKISLRLAFSLLLLPSCLVEAAAVPRVTVEWLRINGAAVTGRMVEVEIADVSPMERSPRGWTDFYCFTPEGSVHVLVPESLATAFLERFADNDDAPKVLAAYVERAADGSFFLRVRLPAGAGRPHGG